LFVRLSTAVCFTLYSYAHCNTSNWVTTTSVKIKQINLLTLDCIRQTKILSHENKTTQVKPAASMQRPRAGSGTRLNTRGSRHLSENSCHRNLQKSNIC